MEQKYEFITKRQHACCAMYLRQLRTVFSPDWYQKEKLQSIAKAATGPTDEKK